VLKKVTQWCVNKILHKQCYFLTQVLLIFIQFLKRNIHIDLTQMVLIENEPFIEILRLINIYSYFFSQKVHLIFFKI